MAEQSLVVGPKAEVDPAVGTLTAAQIRDRYDKGTKAIRAEQLQYEINTSFVAGNQWVYVNRLRNQVVELPRNNDRARITIPRMRAESRAMISKVVQRPLVFKVAAKAADDAHMRGARVAEGVVTATARAQDWDLILREQLAWMSWKGGTGLLCLDWDAEAGDKPFIDPVTNEPLNIGDIRCTALSVTEAATEPGTRNIRKANWWVKAQALPPEEVKTMYGLSKDPAADAMAATSPLQAKVMRDNQRGQQPPDLCLVLTYYERPNPKNKTGNVAVVVGGEIVDGPHPWPFPFTDRLNVVPAIETVVETRWTGDTILSDAVPVQTALNASWSSITEHQKQAGNARLMIEEGSQDLVENYTDEAGEFQLYRENPPAYLSPPQMPQWWIEMPDRLGNQMDDILGRHDVSRGQAPANIESGLGIQILVEQDETPTGHLTRVIANAFAELATLVLRTYEEKVSETRTASVQLPGQPIEETEWTGASFMGQTYVEVPYSAVAPMNEAAKFARAVTLRQVGLLQSESDFASYTDIPGELSFSEQINWHIAKARRENHAMTLGEVMIPAEFDNHALHIEEHNRYRSTGEYEHLPEDQRHIVDMHVQAHSTLAAEEIAAQLLKSQFGDPSLAGAAQANQPPGSDIPNQAPGEDVANNTPRPGGVVNPGTAGAGAPMPPEAGPPDAPASPLPPFA